MRRQRLALAALAALLALAGPARAGATYDALVAATANLDAYYSLATSFGFVGSCVSGCFAGTVPSGTATYGLPAAPNVTGATFSGYSQLSYTNLACMLFQPSASAACPTRYTAGTWAIELWIDGVTGTGEQAAFAPYGAPGSGGSLVGLYVNDPGTAFTAGCPVGQLSAWILAANGLPNYTSIQLCSGIAVNDGAAHHIVFQGNGATLSLYVDAASRASQAVAGATAAGSFSPGGFSSAQMNGIYPLYNLGSTGYYGSSGGLFPLSGVAGGFAFYLAPLTEATIAAHYACGMGVSGGSHPRMITGD